MRHHCCHYLKKCGIAFGGLLLLLGVPVRGNAHMDVPLLGPDAQVIDPSTSTEPYSPKQTCGSCHSYDTITSAYHFQQGFDKVADAYDPAKPWVKSPGMYGKW